jgi:hypothetical protein
MRPLFIVLAMRCLRSSTCLEPFIADLFKLRRRLEVENLFLRHQLNITLELTQRVVAVMCLRSSTLRDRYVNC